MSNSGTLPYFVSIVADGIVYMYYYMYTMLCGPVTDRRSGREEYSANFSGGTGYPALVRPFILKVCSGSDSVRPKFIALIFGLGSGSAANSRFGRNQFCY